MTVVSHRRWAGDAAERILPVYRNAFTAFLGVYRNTLTAFLVQKGINVVGHEKIEVAVAIDVQKGTTGTPQIGIGAAGVRHFGKPAATGVVIQLIRADVGDVQVNQAVIVVIARARTHSVIAVPDARGGCYVLEGRLAAIPVQAMAGATGDGGIGK